MMLIQTYILLQTWRSNGKIFACQNTFMPFVKSFFHAEMNIFQGLSIFISLLTISKEFAEHHFHELSAKSDIPSFGKYLIFQMVLEPRCWELKRNCRQ